MLTTLTLFGWLQAVWAEFGWGDTTQLFSWKTTAVRLAHLPISSLGRRPSLAHSVRIQNRVHGSLTQSTTESTVGYDGLQHLQSRPAVSWPAERRVCIFIITLLEFENFFLKKFFVVLIVVVPYNILLLSCASPQPLQWFFMVVISTLSKLHNDGLYGRFQNLQK